MRTPILKSVPVAALILAMLALSMIAANVAMAQEVSVEGVTLDQPRKVDSYVYRRDYIYLPIRQDPQLGDIPPIPDERSSIGLNEFGDRFIEPLPNRVSDKLDLKRLRARKLGRGMANLFLCWMEIPYQVFNSVEESDPATGLIVGGITGVFFTVTRASVGAFEIVTFWNKRPGDYDVIMEPEFMTNATWGDGVPPFTVQSPGEATMMTTW